MAVFSEGRWGQPERNNFEVGGHGGIPRLNLQFYRMAVFYEEPGMCVCVGVCVCVWNFSREVKLVPTSPALYLFTYLFIYLFIYLFMYSFMDSWNLICFEPVFTFEFGISTLG